MVVEHHGSLDVEAKALVPLQRFCWSVEWISYPDRNRGSIKKGLIALGGSTDAH